MDNPRRCVVIVGASFAGLHLARELCTVADIVDVIIVEPNATVEYTPGILACFTNPGHAYSLVFDTARCIPPHCRWVHGRAISMKLHPAGIGGVVHVALAGGTMHEQAFDWCALATGSTYPAPMKALAEGTGVTYSERITQLRQSAASVAGARSIVIVGGGPVGVELAAEIAVAFTDKVITLVSAAPALLHGLPPALGAAAERWLVRRGVRVMVESRVVTQYEVGETQAEDLIMRSVDGSSAASSTTTASELPSAQQGAAKARAAWPVSPPGIQRVVATKGGERIPASLVITCAGAAPTSSYCTHPATSPSIAAAVDARGRVRVDVCLRVVGCGPALFAIGDVAGERSPTG